MWPCKFLGSICIEAVVKFLRNRLLSYLCRRIVQVDILPHLMLTLQWLRQVITSINRLGRPRVVTQIWIIMQVDILLWEEGNLAIPQWWRLILQAPEVIQTWDSLSSIGLGSQTIEVWRQVVVTQICIRRLLRLMAKVLLRNSKTITSSRNSNKVTTKCHQPHLVTLRVWREWQYLCMR